MAASPKKPDELSPDEFATEIAAEGIALTSANLHDMLAAHRADKAKDERIAELEHEAELRRRELEDQWPLGLLTPPHIDEETSRRFAERRILIVEKIGGRWFGTINNMEIWLRRTGRWFKSAEDERRWRRRFC
jgi:hypothetical protein